MMRILTWPFMAAGALIGLILSAIGRVFAFGLGLALVVIGVVLCASVVGIVLGVPTVIFGGGLMIRSIF